MQQAPQISPEEWAAWWAAPAAKAFRQALANQAQRQLDNLVVDNARREGPVLDGMRVAAGVCRELCHYDYEGLLDDLNYKGFNPHSQESQDGE